jgi:hypothetical protein
MKNLAAVVTALGLGACTGTVDTPGQNDNIEYAEHVQMMPMRVQTLLRAAPAVSAHLQYYGGKVISNVKVQMIEWGSGVKYNTQFPDFYRTFLDSPYMDWLSEYNTSTQQIGRGSYLGDYVDTGAGSATTVDDSKVQSEIARLITAGSVPANDDNTLYMVHFPPGVTITQGGSSSCSAFCAYHGTFKRNGNNVYYGVMPDLGGACASGCGVHDQFGNTCSAATHETIEAVTDAEVGLATSVGPPIAWYDTSQGEIGDICASETDGMIGNYVVQSEWSNQSNACIVTRGTTTTNDFSVALNPTSGSVNAGSTATFTVSTAVVSGP